VRRRRTGPPIDLKPCPPQPIVCYRRAHYRSAAEPSVCDQLLSSSPPTRPSEGLALAPGSARGPLRCASVADDDASPRTPVRVVQGHGVCPPPVSPTCAPLIASQARPCHTGGG